ncbi:hypothetical protein A2368_02700 [Candidatus Collierbacteria bacterium RIFOXYB1_FULL_49_13]|uniref:CBM-cenC domain-containing protein n=1 Tax=Candidatus Collierbacteria bacterium RIFOXYB1_FULL_49_13 TaxID=1817728 RepID=A0A1F5FJ07_9BACT|nr:MAG: hypothetical protein A2368_02700 [Candidatus Collierbacteria bacterium RIFOXYB1_FULL_49_13]
MHKVKNITWLVVVYLVGKFVEGILSRLGENATDKFAPGVPGMLLWIWSVARTVVFYNFIHLDVNLALVLCVSGIMFLYGVIESKWRSWRSNKIIFEDDFGFGNKGWKMNYWGSYKPDETCKIENSRMVFRARSNDLQSRRDENGACIDLVDDIQTGVKYEVSCWVCSTRGSTMKFSLWVHDTKEGNEIKSQMKTPTSEFEQVKVGFIASKTRAMRVHLHYRAGVGQIFVNRVVVIRASE